MSDKLQFHENKAQVIMHTVFGILGSTEEGLWIFFLLGFSFRSFLKGSRLGA